MTSGEPRAGGDAEWGAERPASVVRPFLLTAGRIAGGDSLVPPIPIETQVVATEVGLAALDAFVFDRQWLRSQAARMADRHSPVYELGNQLNLPPAYLLIHRVTLSTIGVLCQLGATVRMRDELEAWLPGFLEADDIPDGSADELLGDLPSDGQAEDETVGAAEEPAAGA